MALIKDRNEVLEVYAEAGEKKWVVPTFCSENLTSTEAILSAVKDYGNQKGIKDLPITIAITNLYDHRSQTLNYTFSDSWQMGMKLFLADLEVLTGPDSPYKDLRVMIHLDHIQPQSDSELLNWDMGMFSSIMYDASAHPFEKNMQLTREFIDKNGKKIVVEGACDEIVDATGNEVSNLTTPEKAKQYIDNTVADFIVANLGTEHRASAKDLKYHGDIAAEISRVIGPKIVLHGCSSVSPDQIKNLYNDGVCKVNIWTAIERDSSPILLEEMVKNAAKVAGANCAEKLRNENLLGEAADTSSKAGLDYFTTVYRQKIIYAEMKKIVTDFLKLWYI